jgi:hypothetical protein
MMKSLEHLFFEKKYSVDMQRCVELLQSTADKEGWLCTHQHLDFTGLLSMVDFSIAQGLKQYH